MSGEPGTRGETWADTFGVAACPTAEDVERARTSEAARREVDLAYACWAGLPEDELAPFLERLRIFDARTPVYEEQRTADALVVQRGRRERLEGHGRVTAPKVYAPRILAPRAA